MEQATPNGDGDGYDPFEEEGYGFGFGFGFGFGVGSALHADKLLTGNNGGCLNMVQTDG